MRASLFLVAWLALAACSSPSLPAPGSYSQTPNGANRLTRANPSADQFTLRIENADKGFSNLSMDPWTSTFKCIASVTPDGFFAPLRQRHAA